MPGTIQNANLDMGSDPYDQEALPSGTADFNQLGTAGVRRYGGWIYEDFLPELQGQRGRQIYREMADNDSIIGGALFAIEMLMRRVEWRMEPADQSKEAEELADFVDSCRDDMERSWPDTLSEIMTMLTFGFSAHEVLFKRRIGPWQKDPVERSKHTDGKIGWRGLPGRAQETILHWTFNEEGYTSGLVQLAPPLYRMIPIPMSKMLLFRTSTKKDNPEGRSILRNAYLSWYLKNNIQRIEAIGVERDLAGYPIAWVPPQLLSSNASPGDVAKRTAFKQVVTNLRRDEQEGMLFPLEYDESGNKIYDLTLLTTGGTRQLDTDKIIARYNQNIAMVTLADFIMLGHEAVGSKALSEDKTQLFGDAISAWLDVIAEIFNTIAIPQLLAVNGIQTELLPVLAHGAVRSLDIVKLGKFLSELATAGMVMFPNDALYQWLLHQIGAPEELPDHMTEDSMLAQEKADEEARAEIQLAKAKAVAQNPPKQQSGIGGQ